MLTPYGVTMPQCVNICVYSSWDERGNCDKMTFMHHSTENDPLNHWETTWVARAPACLTGDRFMYCDISNTIGGICDGQCALFGTKPPPLLISLVTLNTKYCHDAHFCCDWSLWHHGLSQRQPRATIDNKFGSRTIIGFKYHVICGSLYHSIFSLRRS